MKSLDFPGSTELVVCKDSNIAASRMADLIAVAARDAIDKRGRFGLVLTGGSSPIKTYLLLSEPQAAKTLDWSKTFIFLSDERFVPLNDPLSNFAMIQKNLLVRINIPNSNVFSVNTEENTLARAAEQYAGKIRKYFGIPEHAGSPRFDLILLGMGKDGHIASLFPHSSQLDENDVWATYSRPGTLPPFVDRITLTFPVLNAARQIVFLVTGKEKAPVLRDVLEGQADKYNRPAAGIKPIDGKVTWLVDNDAARLLT